MLKNGFKTPFQGKRIKIEEILQQMNEIFKKVVNGYEESETCCIWDRSGCIDRDIKNLISKWYFGHYHDDKAINDKEILYYEKINRIW